MEKLRFLRPLSLLYTTNFSFNTVQVIDVSHPHTLVDSIAVGENGRGKSRQTESIVFRRDGSFLVGNAGGDGDVHEYSAAHVFARQFDVETEDRGADWLELGADQQTLFYTSEGRTVFRFDVSGGGQLADYSNELDPFGRGFALRLLPPYDGSGGLLVADWHGIRRLDGTGAVVQTYDVGEQLWDNNWFALSLDPNGTSFWVGDQITTNIYRFNIASGAIEVGPILSGAYRDYLNGMCVLGESGIFKDSFEDIDQPVDSVGAPTSTNEKFAPRPTINTDCELIGPYLDAVDHSGRKPICSASGGHD